MRKKIVWINQYPSRKGGAERVIENIILSLDKSEYCNILLYKFDEELSNEFIGLFDIAFPIVNLHKQLSSINPDNIQIHNYIDEYIFQELGKYRDISFIFLHDHKIFCPREHKYKGIGKETCKKEMSTLDCFACCGLIQKKKSREFSIVTPHKLSKYQNFIKSCRGVVVASKYMKRQLIDSGFEQKKIFYHALATNFLNIAPVKAIPNEVTYFGQLETGKGVDILIRALALCGKEIIVNIIGDGKSRESLENLALKLGVSHLVNFLGRLQDRDLKEYIGRSVACISPSRSPETFNLAALESLSCGTPVISSKVGAYEEWYIENITGELFESTNFKELSNILSSIYDNREKWEMYRRLIRENFETEKFSVGVYRDFFMRKVLNLTITGKAT